MCHWFIGDPGGTGKQCAVCVGGLVCTTAKMHVCTAYTWFCLKTGTSTGVAI